jgi:hypothetical protein
MTLTTNRLAETNGHAPKKRTRKPKVKTRKVAIVGKAPSSRSLAPYQDKSWEIWGLGDLWRHIPKWDRWFEMHDTEAGKKRWQPDHLEFLKKQENLYVAHPTPELPNAKLYPKDEVLAKFFPYFNNSVSWMIALALHEGITHLGLWGVDMAQSDPATGANGEYEHQRPSCEFFVGVAAGMGVQVMVAAESDLLKTPRLYGFETHTGDAFTKLKAREKELKQRLQEAEAKEQSSAQEKLILHGAIENMKYMRQWVR